MFQTIGYRGGFVQLSYSPSERISAWSHGDMLGDHYRTVAGAKAAITRHHAAWLAARNAEHYAFVREAFPAGA